MCGIVGVLAKQVPNPSEHEIIEMRDTMVSRGPDSAGILQTDAISLAHRRLAIIDTSNFGHQPMLNETTGDIIVFNGEVYNYRSIRDELVSKGVSFGSDSDTEVVLKAYQIWKEKCIDKFIGMFSIAIWDKLDQSLFIARDRLGIKPLYYCDNNNFFAFASQIGALSTYSQFSKSLDTKGLEAYFDFGFTPLEQSIYKGVMKLLPGQWLRVNKSSTKINKYWSLNDLSSSGSTKVNSQEEFSEGLEELITDSIRLRTISDVPIGAFLSGGIDSSLVVSQLCKLTSGRLKTFSIGFEESAFDESQYARSVSEHFDTEHNELIVSHTDLIHYFDTLTNSFEEPFADASALPTLLLSEFTRKQVTVSLSGDGGDELFLGYPQYHKIQKMHLLRTVPPPIRKLISRLLAKAQTPLLGHFKNCLHHNSHIDSFTYIRSLSREFRGSILSQETQTDSMHNTMSALAAPLKKLSAIEQMSLMDMQTYMVDGILRKVDRSSMAYSLEARVPILDHRIVEFVLTNPIHYRYNTSDNKAPLKRMLQSEMPNYNFKRPKAGFNIPLATWFRSQLRELVQDELSPSALEKIDYINPKFATRAIDQHMSGKRNNQSIIWALLCYVRWNRHHNN